MWVATRVPVWCCMLTVMEAVYVRGEEVYGKSVYPLLNFSVDLRLL